MEKRKKPQPACEENGDRLSRPVRRVVHQRLDGAEVLGVPLPTVYTCICVRCISPTIDKFGLRGDHWFGTDYAMVSDNMLSR